MDSSHRFQTVGPWVLRPIVWFTVASMVTTIVHELAHACAAFVLGVRSTLFNYSADLDLTEAQAGTNLPALIRFAGPVFCLGVGMLSWLGLRRVRGSAAELPLLYFSVFGLGTFFGNLMSTSFVGDFSSIAVALRWPMAVRYSVSAIGGLSLAAVHVWAGRELVRWVPARVGRMTGVLGVVALPVIVGTAAVIVANQPMPRASIDARLAEASFWLFAVIAAALVRTRSPYGDESLGLQWVDAVAIGVAVLAVRLAVRGIPFVP